jgi:predicted methyltransferase
MFKLLFIFAGLIITINVDAHKKHDQSTDHINLAISAADRTDADKSRDSRSRPDITLPMLNIGPGDVVFDVFAGGGYYSELIARVVGKNGQVFLHNNQAYRNFVNDALQQRMSNNKLSQMVQHDREVADLGIKANSLDAALIIMSYHDIFYDDKANNWPQIDHQNFISQIQTGLKKGGRFLLVDHNANPGRKALDTQSLHRIEKSYAIERIEAMGFKLVAESTVLASSDDDKNISVFTPEIRGKTDRFIIAFEKQ